ncbi:MAG: Fic family protein [Thermoanaerobaculia bacterium]
MARRALVTELDALVRAAAESAEDIRVGELQAVLPHLPRRTLQRRLKQLAREGRLVRTGRGPAVRYRVPREESARVFEALFIESGERIFTPSLLPLSPEGSEVRRLVDRPIALRTPVGYRRAFLDDSEPNRTHYLTTELRQRLHALGRSPVGDRPAGTYARQILNRLLIDLAWASSRLEGNTYTRLDTQNLIAFGRAAEGKDRAETQMILNHKQAIEMLVEEAETIGFDRYTFQNLHALLAENLRLDPGAAGRLRTIEVAISGTVFTPLAIPQQIDELFGRLLAKADAVEDPFEQAFLIMVHLPYLQPFEDVNRRVSRLGANIPLIRHNLAPLSFVDVPEAEYIAGTLGVYELNRVELLRDVFVWAYERSCQRYTAIKDSLPEPDPLRLRHRDALTAVVSGIVRDMAEIEGDAIRRLAEGKVGPEEMEAFVALAINELYQLHEGNLARFRLRPSEFRRWRAKIEGSTQ